MDRLSILSWNICDEEVSQSAPSDWTMPKQREAIQKTILGRHPDIVCLQEVFKDPLSELYAYYESQQPVASSHRGRCVTFVRRSSGIKILTQIVVGPVTLTGLEIPDAARLWVANCHLYPFNSPARRLDQIRKVLEATQQPGLCQVMGMEAGGAWKVPVVVCGDTNMQESETEQLLSSFCMRDAWIECGRPAKAHLTFDMTVNNFWQESWGKKQCRYDRLMMRDGVDRGGHCSETTAIALATTTSCQAVGAKPQCTAPQEHQATAVVLAGQQQQTQQQQQQEQAQEQQQQQAEAENKEICVTDAHPRTPTGQPPTPWRVSCCSFVLVSNAPVSPTNPAHFLSDHYGFLATVQLYTGDPPLAIQPTNWPSSPPTASEPGGIIAS